MTAVPLRILFVCTHNSARSILAEALLRHHGAGRFEAFSAGSQPRENQQPHPVGLRVLQAAGIATQGLSSKSWDAFAAPGSAALHAVITVCDSAAGESCPLFIGPARAAAPARAHWGYADPSAGDGDASAKTAAFEATLRAIERRIKALVALSDTALAPECIAQSLQELAAA